MSFSVSNLNFSGNYIMLTKSNKRIIASISFAIAASVGFSANATTVVAGNSASVSSASGAYSWDGAAHTGLRSALENPANFGPGGIDTADTIDTVDVATPNAAGLAGVDVFVSSWWQQGQSAPFEADIVSWFLGGGDLFLMQDGPDRDGISNQLGFATINGSANPNTFGSIGSDPFGATGPVNQAGQIGYFDNALILGLGGEIFGTNANGQATAIGFAEGVLGANAGRLVAIGDVDMLAFNSFTGLLNAEETLGLNLFSYLLDAEAPSAVPLPAGLPLMLSAFGLFGLIRARRS